jgi:putative Mg2+ transporter-C (MgtC) family protein
MTFLFANYSEFLFRMLLAALLGGLIGLERDMHGRAAGLRTHLLVSLGAAVFTILSEIIARNANATGFQADPGRIAAQIIAGIGFLGAGVIIKEGANVRGLTTAACLWGAAAIGMAAGFGYSEIAILTTAIALFSLVFLKLLERWYPKDTYRVLSIRTPIEVNASQLIGIVKSDQVKVLNCDIEKNYETGSSVAKLAIMIRYRGIADKQSHAILQSLEDSGLPLKEVRWGQL